METSTNRAPLANQIFAVSGVLTTILSCGLGLGFTATYLHHRMSSEGQSNDAQENNMIFIETAGEMAFVPSLFIIPFTMQKKGRRYASFLTATPVLLSWIISFHASHIVSFLLVNILHNISLGGVVTVGSIVIAEFCSPRYRSLFLMLETAILSLGVFVSHIFGVLGAWELISTVGVLSSVSSLIIIYFSPESPYWLLAQNQINMSTQSFNWLRGRDEDARKELKCLLMKQKLKMQFDALKPMRITDLKKRISDYFKSLLKADFLKPLSIMMLLTSFIGFGGDNVMSNHRCRNVFKIANGKYIGIILMDLLTLTCSLTACILVQIVKRKALFMVTGSLSLIFLFLVALVMFLQAVEVLTSEFTWLAMSFGTGFVMFMSLGTSALPLSLLGEIFPMSYKGVGSSLTCAYLWAFGNAVLRLLPSLKIFLGFNGILFLTIGILSFSLFILNHIMPEVSGKSLFEIESLMETGKYGYEVANGNEQEVSPGFEGLQLFIDV